MTCSEPHSCENEYLEMRKVHIQDACADGRPSLLQKRKLLGVRLAAAFGLIALTACQPQTVEPAPNAAPPAVAAVAVDDAPTPSHACDVEQTRKWVPNGEPAEAPLAFTIDAETNGPNCQNAAAVLAIRDDDGVPLYTYAGPAADISELAGLDENAGMAAALKDWIAPEQRDSASALPEWKDDASAPDTTEMTFVPQPGLDRDGYNQIRDDNPPMFCFAVEQGRHQCAYWSGKLFEDIGTRLPS